MSANIYQMVDKDGNKQYPVTSTEAIGMSGGSGNLKDYLNKSTTEFNVSAFFPTGGTSGSNKYDLASAIGKVPAELRTNGLTVSFLNESGDTEKWEFSGSSWAVGSFEQVGAGQLSEIDKKIGNVDINVVYQVNVGETIIIPIFNSAFKKDYLIRFSVVDDSGAITNYKFMTENGKNIFLTTTFSPNQVYELPVWTEGTAPMRIVINSEYILKDGKITINVEPYYYNNLDKRFSDKQNVLESGVNVKTVNGLSILGSGNVDLPSISMAYAGALAAINVSNVQDAIDKAIEVLGNATYRDIEISVSKDGYYLNATGKEIADQSSQISIPIVLKKGEIIFFTCTGLLNMSTISIKLETTVNSSATTYYVSVAGQKVEQFTYYFISPIDCNVVLSYKKHHLISVLSLIQ